LYEKISTGNILKKQITLRIAQAAHQMILEK